MRDSKSRPIVGDNLVKIRVWAHEPKARAICKMIKKELRGQGFLDYTSRYDRPDPNIHGDLIVYLTFAEGNIEGEEE